MKIEFDNIYARITDLSSRETKKLETLSKDYTVESPGAKYVPAHQLYIKTKGERGWSGQVCLIQPDATFLSGLLSRIVPDLNALGVSTDLIDLRPGRPSINAAPISVNLRKYQWDALTIGTQNSFHNTWWPRGIFKIATGGGKTELAVALYEYLQLPTLFLVHKKTLVNQAVARFKKYGVDVGQMGDGVHDYRSHGITIATIQTIDSFNRRERDLDWLNNIQQVFFDEAHLIASKVATGNTFVKIAAMLPNALIRWGLTATPFMKDNYSNILLEGVTGNVVYEISNSELIRLDYLTPPQITMVTVPKISKLSKQWRESYDAGIILHDSRNNLIIDWAAKVPSPCFILVNETSHAKILQRKASEAGLGSIPILDYKSSTKVREATISKLINNEIKYIICTKIFDEGLDVPRLKSILNCGGGKSKVKALQKLGRLLRVDESKSYVTLIDFFDTSGVHFKHSKERLGIWENEGFTVTKY